jgi:TRAP-type mannitol/chloroaromatic compound transport system permease small subunit
MPEARASDPSVDLDLLAHHTELPHTRASRAIDRLVRGIGDAMSWVWIALLGVIALNVTLRYAFGSGRIELEELQWHLYSVGFLLGIPYAFAADAHIRVDVLRDRMSRRTQAWIELYGILLLLLPFVALVILFAVPFVGESWSSAEISPSPGGLPLRWLIKAALLAGFVLLGLATVSRLLRVCCLLFGAPRAVGELEGG